IASTDMRRPIYRPDLYAYDFDGTVGCHFTDSAIDLTGTDQIPLRALVDTDSSATAHDLLHISSNINGINGSASLFMVDTLGNKPWCAVRGDSVSAAALQGTATLPAKFLLAARFDLAGTSRATEIFPSLNGVVPSVTESGAASGGGGNF